MSRWFRATNATSIMASAHCLCCSTNRGFSIMEIALYHLVGIEVPDADPVARNAYFASPSDAEQAGRDGRFRLDESCLVIDVAIVDCYVVSREDAP